MTRMRKIQSSLKDNLGKLDSLDFTSIVKTVLANQTARFSKVIEALQNNNTRLESLLHDSQTQETLLHQMVANLTQ